MADRPKLSNQMSLSRIRVLSANQGDRRGRLLEIIEIASGLLKQYPEPGSVESKKDRATRIKVEKAEAKAAATKAEAEAEDKERERVERGGHDRMERGGHVRGED